MFHRYKVIAESLFRQIERLPEYASFRPSANMIMEHYKTAFAKPEYSHMHSALCFLISESVKDAVSLIAKERGCSDNNARIALLDGINIGPAK